MLRYPRFAIFLAVLLLLPLSAVAVTSNVWSGYDSYERLPAGNIWDFSGVPIPADFFDPGSDPFVGVINLQGNPLGSTTECPSGLGNADTIVKRLQDAMLPTTPSTDTIQIEIVELSLVSASPITVTYGGGSPELWDVDVTLSQLQPSTGTMEITKTHANGGTFTTQLHVQPRFTFTRQSDSATRVLDDGSQIDTVTTTQSFPWVYHAPGYTCPGCASNFVPGNDGSQEVQITLSGLKSSNAMTSGCAFAGVPALTVSGLIVLLLVVFIAGAVFLARRLRAVKVIAG